jgi:septal ring factor EnvC (AmiA/AmiB activator)
MLIRISLIIAIIAGLAVGVLNFIQVKEKITVLQTHLKEQTEGRQKAETELASTRKDLDKTKTELTQTKTTLEATTAEKATAVAEAAAQTDRANKLTEDLTKTKQERDNAQSEVAAYKISGLSPEQVANLNKQFKELQNNLIGTQEENRVLGQKIKKLDSRLAQYEDQTRPVYLPARLAGKIIVSDPRYKFVVLNVGEDAGVLEKGELLVNRNGRLVAKIKISSVSKDQSVANIMPGWELGEVVEGDQVIPANPAS